MLTEHGWITTLGSQRRMTVQISRRDRRRLPEHRVPDCRSRWTMLTPPGGDETGRLSFARAGRHERSCSGHGSRHGPPAAPSSAVPGGPKVRIHLPPPGSQQRTWSPRAYVARRPDKVGGMGKWPSKNPGFSVSVISGHRLVRIRFCLAPQRADYTVDGSTAGFNARSTGLAR